MVRQAQKLTDAGEAGMDAAPERTCAVTRTAHEPDELIRFVCGPDGQIFPDLARRLPGRGVWVGCARARVQAAVKTGAFARSLRRQVTVSPDLPDAVDKLMLRRVMDALSLANKAGLALAGFAKVEEAITAGQCVALLHASDAADDGAGKLDRKFRAIWMAKGLAGEPTIVRGLASAELSLAMGRSNVVHAALNRGGAASNFLSEAERLQRYRASPDVQARSPEAGAKTDQA